MLAPGPRCLDAQRPSFPLSPWGSSPGPPGLQQVLHPGAAPPLSEPHLKCPLLPPSVCGMEVHLGASVLTYTSVCMQIFVLSDKVLVGILFQSILLIFKKGTNYAWWTLWEDSAAVPARGPVRPWAGCSSLPEPTATSTVLSPNGSTAQL